MILLRKPSFYFAIIGVIAAVLFSLITQEPLAVPVYAQHQVESPYANFIEASGIVESSNRNILIGVPDEGIVTQIWHVAGDQVKKGEPLFEIDNRALKANLDVLKANANIAKATLAKQSEKAHRLEAINDPRAISNEEVQSIKNDVLVSEAQLAAAQASIKEKEELIERHTIRAPIDGVILRDNIRVGQYVNNEHPAMIFGNLDQYQLRVSIDEENASYFDKHMPATAYFKNNTSIKVPLKFKRIEPYVIPKKEITNEREERVDTRVLQVSYTFNAPLNFHVFVGQQMDVYIERKGDTTVNE
jgi:HlyD family secretion protein